MNDPAERAEAMTDRVSTDRDPDRLDQAQVPTAPTNPSDDRDTAETIADELADADHGQG